MQGLVTDRAQSNVLRRNELAAKGWSGMTADERAEWLGSPLSESAANLLPYAPYYSSVVELKHTNDAVIAKATAAGSYLYAVQIIGAATDFMNKTMTLSADYIGTVDGASPQIVMYWHDGNGYEPVGEYELSYYYVVGNRQLNARVGKTESISCANNIRINRNGIVELVDPIVVGIAEYQPTTYPYFQISSDSLVCYCDSKTMGYVDYTLTARDIEVYSNQVAPQVVLSSAGSITFNTGENLRNRYYLAMYIYVTTDAAVEIGAAVRFRGLMLEFGDTRHEYAPYVEVIPNNATKGAYNYSDLNRVERAAAELSELYGLNLKTKADWGVWDVPRLADMARYLTNIRIIRQACMNPNIVAAAPESMGGLTYNDANNIEKILLAAHEQTDHIYRVGELFSGEVN